MSIKEKMKVFLAYSWADKMKEIWKLINKRGKHAFLL